MTIILIILCAAVVIILAISNGDNVKSWQVQPSVLLSLIASGLGFCTAFIYGEGARIGWWLFLIRGGTLKEVHERSKIASSPLSAALYPFKRLTVNRVVVGCLGSTAMFATGAFLQRASTVVPGLQVQNINISIPVAPELPYPFSSIHTGRTTTNDYLTPIFAKTLRQFQSRAPIAAPNSTCNGYCRSNVLGAGFTISCNDSTCNWTFNTEGMVVDFHPKVALEIDFNYTYDTPYNAPFIPTLYNPALMVDIRYKTLTLPTTLGFFENTIANSSVQVGVYRHCMLRPATVLYPVLISAANTITNTTSTTDQSTSSTSSTSSTTNDNVLSLLGTITTDPVIKVFNQTYDSTSYANNVEGGDSTYLAYVDAISAFYSDNIGIRFTGAVGYEIQRNTTSSSPFGLFYIQGAPLSDVNIDQLVNITFNDPTTDILSAMRELMFRMSVAATIDPAAAGRWSVEGFNTTNGRFTGVPIVPPLGYFSANRSLQAVQTTLITVYKTEHLYVVLALTWVLLVVLCIMHGYWGFWHLGRNTSLSPLEIARAFEAPLLSGTEGGCGSNEPLDSTITRVGTKKVRYGEVIIVHDGATEKGHEHERQQVEKQRQNGGEKTARGSEHSISNSSSNANSSSNKNLAQVREGPVVSIDEAYKANANTTKAGPHEANNGNVQITGPAPLEMNAHTTKLLSTEVEQLEAPLTTLSPTGPEYIELASVTPLLSSIGVTSRRP